MEAKKTDKEGTNAHQDMVPIEELQEKHEVPGAVLAGMKAANGWRAGARMTEESFLLARKAFLAAPIDGRKERKR